MWHPKQIKTASTKYYQFISNKKTVKTVKHQTTSKMNNLANTLNMEHPLLKHQHKQT